MAITVKPIALWRKEVENQVGALAQTLAPVKKAGGNLRLLMGYRYPGNEARAAIELYPVSGKKVTDAASGAGLAASAIPILLVEGDDKPGLAHDLAEALAGAGINLSFFVAQGVGRKFSAILGFDTEADAQKATPLLKKAASGKRK